MQNRNLLILLVVVIVAGGVYYYQQHTQTASITLPGGKDISVTTHN